MSAGAPRCSAAAADIVFVVDSSGSIRDKGFENWDIMLNFVADIVAALPIGRDAVRIGMVVYSNDARNEFFLDTDFNQNSIINRITNARSVLGSQRAGPCCDFALSCGSRVLRA